ncbi:MAG TPA: SMP-30/gluconolactonase/LRE family protein [Micromonosporaceae bacterium]|jgi:sugar lactone lactonase YvrE
MSESRTLVSGRGLVESPRWSGDRWYVSDWSAGEVFTVESDGRVDVVATVESLPLCTAFTTDGRLILVDSTRGRLLRREPDGSLTTYRDLGRPGWNDIVIDGRDNVYVNGAGFDPATGAFTPGGVTLAAADGTVRAVADDIAFPNGMAVTPDNGTLIVADSHRHCLVAFDIADDGGLSGRRVWADLDTGTPDGICIDAEGAVWYADVPNRSCVRVTEGGAVHRTITLDRGGFACALGGPDGTTLCIVGAGWRSMAEGVDPGSGQVLVADVDVPGAGWP